MFGGYNRHTWCETMWSRLSPLPRPIRNLSAYALMMVSPDTWDHLFRASAQVLPRKLRLRMPGYKMHKLALAMGRRDPYEMYYGFVSHWDRPESVVKDAIEPPTAITQNDRPQFGTVAEGLMFLDSITYLPDDILVKVDRATMDVALEGRIPYLDHRVAEFAWRLPLAMRVRGQEGKWILRQLLYRYVPREMVDRPKSGFGFALDAWLRGGLRDWAEGLLAEDRIRSEGFFQPEPIRQRWKEHLSGQRNWAYLLWDILMFQAWLEDSRRSPVADPRISAYEVQARETA